MHALAAFVAFLGFEAEGGDGPRHQAGEADGLARLLAEAVVALFDQGREAVVYAGRAVGEALGGVSETDTLLLTAEVCAMRLEEFARAGLVVEVLSAVLEEVVVFASDKSRFLHGTLRPL